MPSLIINTRFCGPPNSGNGGYVCGLLAAHIGDSAEITLRLPPPLERTLDVVAGPDGTIDLWDQEVVVATGRATLLEISEIPTVNFSGAEEAVHRTPYDNANHKLPTCFVCGPARHHGDGLRIFAGPVAVSLDPTFDVFAAPWVPYANLAGHDGRVAAEFVWAALDCPTGYASLGARPLGMTGEETILLGRMAARVIGRPKPGDRCVVTAWPTGRSDRKLFANSALLGPDGEVLAIARTIWLMVDRNVQVGQRSSHLPHN